LTAFAIARLRMANEISDWALMDIFVQCVNGMTSVGLKANEFVSPRYR
jgi:hypothetical protein